MPELAEIDLSDLKLDSTPFPHFSVNTVFNEQVADDLLTWFEDGPHWSFTKTSFYTQFEFSLNELDLPGSLTLLNNNETLSYLCDKFNECFHKKVKVTEITAHKLIDGYKMGVHNDFIGGDETHRLVIQINNQWSTENGGYLMFFNSSRPEDVARIVQPLHNSGIGFEISDKSYHAVSAVHNFTRYTLVYTFKEVI